MIDRIAALTNSKPMACYILYRDGRCLMESRPDLHRMHFDPYWVYPGGKIESDELARQAAMRECVEELGVYPNGTYLLEQICIPNGWMVIPYVFVYWRGEIPTHTLDEHHSILSWRPPYIEMGQPDDSTCVRQIANQIARRIDEIDSLAYMCRKIMAHL